MNMPSDSRSKVLQHVRAATKNAAHSSDVAAAYQELPRTYVCNGRKSSAERVALMIERLREYDADVVETGPDGLAGAIAAQLRASGRQIFAAPKGLPAEWMADGFDWKIDHDLSAAAVEACEGVVTGASCGVADSGTIVLHHGVSEGRRIITLLPDWHLCILYASQIVETLPEYFAGCGDAPALATYISGPSATADIEMTRIKGVHGPRYLNVIVVHDLAQN